MSKIGDVIMFNQSELEFYKIIGAIADSGAPIVFKGALVTKLLLQEHDCSINRLTKDIDADWVNQPPSMEQLENILNEALGSLGEYVVKPFRTFEGSSKSAGFKIYEHNDLVTTIDISMKANPFFDTYSFGDIAFRGSSINKIMADKLAAISNEKVFRRCKDVVDVYALSSCVVFDFYEINQIIKKSDRTLGEFSEFLNHKDELHHAYNKLKRIEHKPDFDVIYNMVKNVISPFVDKGLSPSLFWDPQKGKWLHEAFSLQLNASQDVFNKNILKKDTMINIGKSGKQINSFANVDHSDL